MNVSITKDASTISVEAPYNSVFVDGARALAGKWNQPKWVFDLRDQTDVMALAMRAYGTDGNAVDQCDVRLTIEAMASLRDGNGMSASFCGRPLARIFGRDSGARVSEGVIIEQGKFDSGGSRGNPLVVVAGDLLVIKLRDLSHALVREFISEENDGVSVEIMSVNSNLGMSDADLIEELAMLEARVAEIKAMLSGDRAKPVETHNAIGIHTDLADA